MKRAVILIVFLLLLSLLSGYLLSSASWAGKVGISMFYKEYEFLKYWYKGAALCFIIWMFLLGLQALLQSRLRRTTSIFVHLIAIMLALFGRYFSYSDFRQNISHRILGERFHLGAYLFWIGWLIISLYFILQKKQQVKKKHHHA